MRMPHRGYLGFFNEYKDKEAIQHIMNLLVVRKTKPQRLVIEPYPTDRQIMEKDADLFIRLMSDNPLTWFSDTGTIYSGTSREALRVLLKLRDTEINTKYPVDIDRFMELVAAKKSNLGEAK